MKIQVNQTLQLSWPQVHEISQKWTALIFFNFHEPWKSSKIRRFNFLQFSWPRVHENPQKSDDSIIFNFHDTGYMKFHKNQTLWFSSTFMTPGVYENQQKSDDSIFRKNQTLWFWLWFLWIFMYWVMKIEENWIVWFLRIFMTPGTWKLIKIWRFDYLQFSWSRVHEN